MTKTTLTKEQFEFFGKKLFNSFSKSLSQEDKNILKQQGVSNWQIFMRCIKPENINGQIIHTETGILFAESIPLKLNSESPNKSFDEILEDAKKSSKGKLYSKNSFKQHYLVSILKYLSRFYANHFVNGKSDIFSFGGSKKIFEKDRANLFLWYAGYPTIDALKNAYSSETEGNFDKSLNEVISYYSRIFDRGNEWKNADEKWNLEGTYKVEATEGKAHPEPDDSSIVQNQLEMVKWVHEKVIDYDKRYSYWGQVKITKAQQKGFYFGTGLLYTNTQIPELDEWSLHFILSIRHSRDTEYICMDYEMIPKSKVDSPRTFGYCIFRPPESGEVPKRFKGYFFSNRMRDPYYYSDNDKRFQEGLKISMGRCVLYKEDA